MRENLALRDALAAEGAHKVVDAPRGDALNIGLLNHGEERAFGASVGFEQCREVAALAELRDLQLQPR